MTTTPKPHLTQFHLFSLLPKELQLHIWTFLLPGPRDLKIDCKKGIGVRRKRFAEAYSTSTPPPILLSICPESRDLALQTYAPYFRTENSNRVIYLNFALDTLRFPDGVISYVKEPELMAIQNLVLEVGDCVYFAHFNMEILKGMRGLKRLEIWATQTIYGWYAGSNINKVVKDFKDAKEADPGWECPSVRVLDLKTNEKAGIVEAGALIPGWVAEVDGEAGNYEPEGTNIDFV